jgi:Lhr-like helicase
METSGLASMPKAIKTRRRFVVPGPTVVQSVRVRTYPEYIRLVLDLQRSVIFTQSRHGNERVVIELQNSFLAKAVRSQRHFSVRGESHLR